MIFILDDDSLVSRLLDELVHEAGLTCEISGDIEDAYRRIMERGNEFALGIIDLRIGGDAMAGLTLVSMIRQIDDPEKAQLPIALMTGAHDFENYAKAAAEMRLCALLTKPFTPDEFYAMIERCSRWQIAVRKPE